MKNLLSNLYTRFSGDKKAVFIAATAQHVGKTTTCLGIMSGLQKRIQHVGFIKPVGQRHVDVGDGVSVDKDVVLFRERFGLASPYPLMSPVILPQGFTRDYLDGKISHQKLVRDIEIGFDTIYNQNEYTVVEGTGHGGVGSIIDLSNADVAALLGLDVVLVTTGGLGAAFDQLALNLEMFKSKGVRVKAIILNKVLEDKRDMILDYIPKAIKKWDVPLAGCIPYSELLNAPSMYDYENLFQMPLIAGGDHKYRHFTHERLVLTSVSHYRKHITPKELIITHATRDDIIRATIADEVKAVKKHRDGALERGMILVGHQPPSKKIVDEANKANFPLLYAPVSAYKAMGRITGFTAKIRREDVMKVDKAINLVEENLDFEVLCED